MVHVTARVEGAMIVDPLIGRLIGRCKLGHLGLPHNHCTQIKELRHIFGVFLLGFIKSCESSAHHCSLDTFQAKDVFERESSASEWTVGRVRRVYATGDGNIPPYAIVVYQSQSIKSANGSVSSPKSSLMVPAYSRGFNTSFGITPNMKAPSSSRYIRQA